MGIFFGRNKKAEEAPSTIVEEKVEESCERWRNDNADSYTIAACLQNTFGTTDLERVLEIAKTKHDNADPYTIAACLQNTFGTTDLNRVAELFLSEKNREKLKEFVK